MRIGVDARGMVNHADGRIAGVSQFTSAIIQAMQAIGTDKIILCNETGRSHLPIVSNHLQFSAAVHRIHPDVFFSPTGLLPLGLKVPSVAFIHDVFILKHPEWFPDSLWQRLFTLRVVLPATMRSARRLIVPSECVRRDLIEAFPQSEKKIFVVSEGVVMQDRSSLPLTDAIRERLSIRSPYMLTVSTLEPRKNFLVALNAFARVLKDHPNFQYVIAGKRGWKDASILSAIDELNKRYPGSVCYVGAVSEDDKHMLYANAELYLSTSLAEGFGLPVFEAMAHGVPVIATPVGAIPDLAEGCVEVIPSDDTLATQQAISRLLRDPEKRQSLQKKGYDVIAHLTWRETAYRIVQVLYETV